MAVKERPLRALAEKPGIAPSQRRPGRKEKSIVPTVGCRWAQHCCALLAMCKLLVNMSTENHPPRKKLDELGVDPGANRKLSMKVRDVLTPNSPATRLARPEHLEGFWLGPKIRCAYKIY